MRKDLKLHFIAGSVISIIAGLFIMILFGRTYMFLGWFIAAAAGIVKELFWDKLLKNGMPELTDAFATIVGGLLCFFLYIFF